MSSLLMNYPEAMLKPKSSKRPDDTTNPEMWVDAYGDLLYSYALLRLRDRNLAEEVVQETFLAALKARHNFVGQSSEKTWLIGILKHKIIDHFRRASREQSLADFDTDASEQEFFHRSGKWIDHWTAASAPKDWTYHPDQSVEQQEFWEVFNRCLAKLPSRLATAFTLREIDGFSSAEICRIMNISINNLWVMLHRARALLRRSLEANWFAPQG